jgi:large subunit ribosomal protein L25
MKEIFQINAIPRDDTGKGASRRLRREGLVPGIIYGGGKDPKMVSTVHNKLIQKLDNEAFYSHILKVDVDGQSDKVVLKDLQRHPSRPFIMHFDLLRVSDTDRIKMFVPFHFPGEDVAPGVKAGGMVSHQQPGIEIICQAKDLPEYIEIDISEMEIGDTVHLSEVKLPQGVEIASLTEDHDIAIVSVHAAKVEEEEEVSPTEAGEAGEAVATEGDAEDTE